jgi:hypothetical protein
MVVYAAIFSCGFLLPFPPLWSYKPYENALVPQQAGKKALAAFIPYRSLRLLLAFFARL